MRYLALAVAITTLAAGIRWGSTTAGGADSYGYVSQAGLWLNRQLTIQQDIIRQSPWPNAADTWAPLGYRASPHARDAIVPLYAPGLAMVMALFQLAGGFCAAFFVVPLSGALAVWLTWRLGERLFARPVVSLSAAVLLATSPVFLYQLMNPMTDIPVTAAWTLALVLVMGDWPLAAGLAAGTAILIRPNLAPVALALFAWLALARRRPLRFAAGVAPFALAVGAINASIYESALISGYGTLNELYSVAHLPVNASQFWTWTAQTQTPLVLLAAAYFVVPGWFPAARVPYPRVLIAVFAGAVKLPYLFYQPFDAWWYLRFLLPVWPIMAALMAAAFDAVARRWLPRIVPAVVLGAAMLLAANGLWVARARFAFDVGRAERRYADVARFVAARTEPNAVVLAVQHSGTLRMYAGRLTLRFDQLDPAWLDRALAFLAASGRHPFIVVEDGEAAIFTQRFGRDSDVGRLDWAPVGSFDDGRVRVYDAVDRSNGATPLAIAASRSSGWRCDPPYTWPTPNRIE